MNGNKGFEGKTVQRVPTKKPRIDPESDDYKSDSPFVEDDKHDPDTASSSLAMAVIQFPPNLDEELLWWNDDMSSQVRLRNCKIVEVGRDNHASKIQFRDGTLRFPTSTEMESRCTSHNKFAACEVGKVQLNIQDTTKEICVPREVVKSPLNNDMSAVEATGSITDPALLGTKDNAAANATDASPPVITVVASTATDASTPAITEPVLLGTSDNPVATATDVSTPVITVVASATTDAELVGRRDEAGNCNGPIHPGWDKLP
jgi:hypothetical protein